MKLNIKTKIIIAFLSFSIFQSSNSLAFSALALQFNTINKCFNIVNSTCSGGLCIFKPIIAPLIVILCPLNEKGEDQIAIYKQILEHSNQEYSEESESLANDAILNKIQSEFQ